MKVDKLFYVFELMKKRLLSFKPQQGNATLANTSLKMIKELISKVKPESVRMILDAGGSKGSVINPYWVCGVVGLRPTERD